MKGQFVRSIRALIPDDDIAKREFCKALGEVTADLLLQHTGGDADRAVDGNLILMQESFRKLGTQ